MQESRQRSGSILRLIPRAVMAPDRACVRSWDGNRPQPRGRIVRVVLSHFERLALGDDPADGLGLASGVDRFRSKSFRACAVDRLEVFRQMVDVPRALVDRPYRHSRARPQPAR